MSERKVSIASGMEYVLQNAPMSPLFMVGSSCFLTALSTASKRDEAVGQSDESFQSA